MAVLSDSKFLISSMFHIRWWKHYNYFFCTEFGMNQHADLHAQINKIHMVTNNECYNPNGSYRGCFASRKGFLEQHFEVDTIQSSPIMNVMCAIIAYINDCGPILKHTKVYNKYLCHDHNTNTPQHDLCDNDTNTFRGQTIIY